MTGRTLNDKKRTHVRCNTSLVVPTDALATEEQHDEFCRAVITNGSSNAAAKAWGMTKAAVYWHAATHPEFGAKLDQADACLMRSKIGELFDRNEELLKMPPKEMNLCANAYRLANEQVLRMLGILNRKYSEKQAAATQVNVQNNVGLVCDEETRTRLIALNQKLLTNGNNEKRLAA